MNPGKKLTAVLAALVFLSMQSMATTRKVLFIGNSYTYTNNMPLMLQTLATTMGDTLVYDESDPGGYTLELHSAYAPTISKIFAQKWDVVVVQEQSQLPAFPPAEVDTEVYPYAHAIDSMIHKNDNCTQTMFLMTWGHANGDPMNCGAYPAICTYDGMQQRLRESYLEMTHDNKAVVAPVGAAWKVVHDSFITPWLFISDSSHPLVAGSYLEACVLYSSIFHKRTLGCTSIAGLSTGDATILQRIADRVTMDSLYKWQLYGHYPNAGFDYTVSGKTYTTNYTPLAAADYYWDFGDGGTDTASAPVHTYTADGTYTISHSAVTDCFTETVKKTIRIGATTGVQEVIATPIVKTITEGNGRVTFLLPAGGIYDAMQVYDVTGRQQPVGAIGDERVAAHFAAGVYVLKATNTHTGAVYLTRFCVY